jgi:hypothetical protein
MENVKDTGLLGDEEVDGRILLKWTVEKCAVRIAGGRNWLEIGFNEGLLY